MVSLASLGSHLVLLGLHLPSLRLVRPPGLVLHLDSVPPLEILRLLRHQLGRHSDRLLPLDKLLPEKPLHLSPQRQLNGGKRTSDRPRQASILQLPQRPPLRSSQLSRPSRCRRTLVRIYRFQGCRSVRVQMMHNRKRDWGWPVCSALLHQQHSLRLQLLLRRLAAARSTYLQGLARSQSLYPGRQGMLPTRLLSRYRNPHRPLAKRDLLRPLLVNLGLVRLGSVRQGLARPCLRRPS